MQNFIVQLYEGFFKLCRTDVITCMRVLATEEDMFKREILLENEGL